MLDFVLKSKYYQLVDLFRLPDDRNYPDMPGIRKSGNFSIGQDFLKQNVNN